MIKHLILWQLKDELSPEEKETVKKEIKEGLEGLVGLVPGLESVHVQIDCLETSNADLLLDSLLLDQASLAGYAVHPAHVKVADEKVRPFTKCRVCMDFEL